MRSPQQGIHVLIQSIPLHLGEERKPVLVRYLCQLFYFCHPQLLLNREGMQKVATKDKRVLGRVDGVDPARWYQECVALVNNHPATFLDNVAEKYIRLFSR